MQRSLENTSALGRRMLVEVPEERLATEVQSRLRSMAAKLRVSGFRRGKVPFAVVEQRYGKQVRNEVVSEVLEQSTRDALSQGSFQLAGQVDLLEVESQPGTGLRFRIEFDVYPKVDLDGLDTLHIVKPLVSVSEADVTTAVESLRDRYRTLIDTAQLAQSGDILALRVRVSEAGRNVPDLFPAQEDALMKLGSGQFDEDFEQQLIGKEAGAVARFTLTFPSGHRDHRLQGRQLCFEVHIKRVMIPELPPLDAEFFRHCGVQDGDLATFRTEVQRSLERKAALATRHHLRQQLQQALYRQHPQELPQRLLHQKEVGIRKAMAKQSATGRVLHESAAPDTEVPRGTAPQSNAKETENFSCAEQAAFLLNMEIIYRHIQNTEQITADPQWVRKYIDAWAESYQDSAAMVRAIYADPEQLERVRGLCVDERVEDFLLGKVQLEERPFALDELFAKADTATPA